MFNTTTLRDQISRYLRDEIRAGELRPGSSINMDKLSRELSISKTPLKEALIRLEAEGFVEIQSRRGFFIHQFSNKELKDCYEMIGILESSVLADNFDAITTEVVAEMERINNDMTRAFEQEEYDDYRRLNLEFHDVILKSSGNDVLRTYVNLLKSRLYDFTESDFMKEWGHSNIEEHKKLLDCFRAGDAENAVRIIREEQWGWSFYEPYFTRTYQNSGE